MSGRQETVDDILAEMRMALKPFPFVYSIGRHDAPAEFDANGLMTKPRSIVIENVTVPELCSRIEAAMNRETAAMRNALIAIEAHSKHLRALEDGREDWRGFVYAAINVSRSALAVLQGEKK